MKILRNNRRVFAYIGFFSQSEERIFDFKYSHIISTLLMLLLLFLFLFSSMAYTVNHLKIRDYENCLYAGVTIAATIPLLISYFGMMYHKEKVRDVIDAFQKISDESM